MAGKRKLSPREAFDANMKRAELLVKLAKALENRRRRRVRAELRERVGTALRIQKKKWPEIECVESDDLFVVFKPTAGTRPDDISDPDRCSDKRSSLLAPRPRHLSRIEWNRSSAEP
jgi:hypothetical protein